MHGLRRVFLGWSDNSDTQVNLSTGQIAKLFGVNLGMHPVIQAIRGLEVDNANVESLFCFVDPRAERLTSTGIYLMSDNGAGNRSTLQGDQFSRKMFIVRADAGDSFRDIESGPFHVLNDLTFTKTATSSWELTIDYTMESGAMMWLDEWAAMLADKYQVPNDRTQGYNMVGDYFQIGKREQGFVAGGSRG